MKLDTSVSMYICWGAFRGSTVRPPLCMHGFAFLPCALEKKFGRGSRPLPHSSELFGGNRKGCLRRACVAPRLTTQPRSEIGMASPWCGRCDEVCFGLFLFLPVGLCDGVMVFFSAWRVARSRTSSGHDCLMPCSLPLRSLLVPSLVLYIPLLSTRFPSPIPRHRNVCPRRPITKMKNSRVFFLAKKVVLVQTFREPPSDFGAAAVEDICRLASDAINAAEAHASPTHGE